MGEYEKKIKEITGLDESKFVKLWIDQERDWVSAMKHVAEHGIRCLKMINNDPAVTWDENQRTRRTQSNRACLTLPVISDFVNKAHGEFCMTAPQVTVEPVDSGADVKTAEVYRGLIYNTSYQFSGDAIHKDAAYYVFSAGIAAWRVNTQWESKDSFNVDPNIQPIINPFAVRWDLTANKPDMSDKKWVMILQPISKEDFIDKYGEDKWNPVSVNKSQGTSQEYWFEKDKAMLAEVQWIQEDEFTLYEQPDGTVSDEKPGKLEPLPDPQTGEMIEPPKLRERKSYRRKVWSCIISGSEVLSEPTEWPDRTEDPIIPIMIATGRKIVIEGKIYYKSLISDGLDIAQLINYWITAITEAQALQPDAPWLVAEGQIAGFPEWGDTTGKYKYLRWKRDPAHPEAGPPQRISPPTMHAAGFQMLDFLHSAMRNAIGMQQASLGQQGNEKSGIAIQKRKQEGDAGKFPFIENLQRQIELESKVLVNILPTIMDTKRIERVMGPDGKSSLVYLKEQHKDNPDPDKVLDLSNGKYDTRITLGPTFATQRDEQRDMAMQWLQVLGPINPGGVNALSPKFAKFMNFADADQWEKILIATLPPNMQAFYQQEENKDAPEMQLPPEMMQQVQAIAQKLQQAEQIMQQQAQEMDKLKREEGLKIAEIQAKTGIEKEKLAVEREKIMRDITIKEKEIEARNFIELEKIEADVTMKMTELMEGARDKREAILDAYKSRIEKEQGHAGGNESRPLLSEVEGKEGEVISGGDMPEVNKTISGNGEIPETQEEELEVVKPEKHAQLPPINITVDARSGKGRKTISLTAPSGKVYTGEVVEQEDETRESE